jgi:hypothetical protein
MYIEQGWLRRLVVIGIGVTLALVIAGLLTVQYWS